MSSEDHLENAKVAVCLRSARTAIGWNQQEFADLMGVARSTVARIETMEMAAKADFLIKAMGLFKSAGVDVNLFGSRGIGMEVTPKAVENAFYMLKDESKRRSDRKPK